MTRLKINTLKAIDSSDLDNIVTEVYGKPYCFQQQEGCQSRGIRHIFVPNDGYDFPNDTIPEIVNGSEMGVSFKAWMDRSPDEPLKGKDYNKASLELWWHRNFYPSLNMVLNDLHKKGIIDEGSYVLIIDW